MKDKGKTEVWAAEGTEGEVEEREDEERDKRKKGEKELPKIIQK